MNKYRRFNNRLLKARETMSRPKYDFKVAIELSILFLEMNEIAVPQYSSCYLAGGRGEYIRSRVGASILISPNDCHWKGWSKPGNKADVTTFGVAAHETAHHVHAERLDSRDWMKQRHRNVTSYAGVNLHEQIAEAGRLFILNPMLLKIISPGSYAAFVAAGLRHGKE